MSQHSNEASLLWGKWVARDAFWRFVAVVVVAFTMVYGATYVASGSALAHAPSFYVLQSMPGGMRTHGAALVLLAGALLYGLGTGSRALSVALVGLMFYAVWISTAIIWAWQITGQVVISAPMWWLFLLAPIAFGLWKYRTPHN